MSGLFMRVLLRVPAGLTFEALTLEQQAAIASVFGQYVMPMPSTIEADGFVVCDAVTKPNFDPSTMDGLGLNWPILGIWDNSGAVIVPLDEAAFMAHLPDTIDEEGNSTPAVLHEPHRWAGWPDLF